MAPPAICDTEKDENFDSLFDHIDADAPTATMTRGRTSELSSGTLRSTSKSKRSSSKVRARSRGRAVSQPVISLSSEASTEHDSDNSSANTKARKPRTNSRPRAAAAKGGGSFGGGTKREKSLPRAGATRRNPAPDLEGTDLFGESFCELATETLVPSKIIAQSRSTNDLASLSQTTFKPTRGRSRSRGRTPAASSQPDQSSNLVVWKEGDDESNRLQFLKLLQERKALKKLVDELQSGTFPALTNEVAALRMEVRNSDDENRKLRMALADGAGNTHKLQQLQEENNQLRHELQETVQRASTMVKDRETATDQLLEEVERLREEAKNSRRMFDATLYKNKQKTEELDHQNDLLSRKVAELQEQLAKATGRK